MNSADPVILGPFVGGLNTQSDPSSITEEQLVECNNLELDLNSSLIARPPVADFGISVTTQRGVAIGTATFIGQGSYVIFSNSAGVWALRDNETLILITNTMQAMCAIQYNDKVWLVRKGGSGSGGGNWSPLDGFAAIAGMPNGGSAVIYKERMWIAPGYDATTFSSRMYFSAIANPGSWTIGTDFFDITPGDGGKIIDVLVHQNNLLVFKNDSTHILSYDTKPADATVLQVSSTIGTSRQYCKAVYEQYIYVYHEGLVYELINYNYSPLNVQVPFESGDKTPARSEEVCLFVLGDRLCIRVWSNLYVFGFRTRTWSKWYSSNTVLNNFGVMLKMPLNLVDGLPDIYYGGNTITSQLEILKIKDTHTTTDIEKLGVTSYRIKCSIITKNYDFGVGHLYKRLFWWGADVLSDREVTGTITPIVFGFSTVWGDLAGFIWNNLLGTWELPTSSTAILTTVTPSGFGSLRRFIKFPRSVRFRQMNFKIELETDGTINDGPCKLYSLTAIVRAKQTVSKQVS